MIQAPVTPVPQAPIAPQPSYNAVKIDIHNPQVNVPNYSQCQACAPVTAPVYEYPQAPVYEVPKQSIYTPTPQQPVVAQPPAVQELPSVPPPVIVQPTITQIPAATIPVASPAVDATPITTPTTVTIAEPTPTTTPAAVAAPQTVEVKAPEVTTPQIDLNEFISKLTSPDYEVQASTMESIADLVQKSPQKATELLDVKVVDTLLNIMATDTSKLTGPTPQQLQIREKIMSGKPVTEAETAEANKITPMEQAERNKQYAIYTVAILQKLYGSEIEKMNNTVVPLTELPGAAGIVEQVKNNPNPMVRASGIDALSYIQRPEYKQDLTTLFTVAQKDQDINVQQAAKKALEKLAKIADAPTTEAPAPVVTATAATNSNPQPTEEVKAA